MVLCIELIRQFYTLPRKFRILGEYGAMEFVQYSNAGLMQQQMGLNGEIGYRKPEFDIKVYAQKRSVYTKVANNELAIQFFQMGFFNPQMAEQALMCMEMMDFDGKDELMQKVSRNSMIFQKFAFYLQQCLMMAGANGNAALAQQAAMDMQQYLGVSVQAPNVSASASIGQQNPEESTVTRNARQKTANTTAPKEG